MKYLNNFIRVYDYVISGQTCNTLIDLFEHKYKDNHEVHDTELYKFHQLNLGQNQELQIISQNFAKALVPYMEEYFRSVDVSQYVGIQGFEEVRIKRYIKNTNDQFKTHVDVTDKESARRYLIAMLYLNDNNGVTEFPTLGMSITPKQGSVVMFPPMWLFPHAGRIPTDDDKYIMMTSLHYL
jgi:prolyl 4-hydroxylase